MEIKESYDVIVVGAGPAGSSTAKTCAELGLDVVVFDRNNEIGAPKRCGEGISFNSSKRLGLNIPQRCIAQIINGAYAYAPNGKEVKVQFEGTGGYVLERKVFDKWLCYEAAKTGAKIITKIAVTDLIMENGFVKGVVIDDHGQEKRVYSKIVVAADGVESVIMRLAGIRTNKSPMLVDSGYQYEMAGIDMRDPHMIELFFGNKIAPRGYCWIFPKGEHEANVGIGISGAHKEKKAKQYLDEFIASHPALAKGSIIEVNAGSIPVGGLMEDMVGDGIIGVGDSVNQVNAIHGGGIPEAITAGKLAAHVIKSCFDKNDFSKKSLGEYNKLWWDQRGQHLKNVEKVRETAENMNDDNLNDIAEVLSGEDLADFAHGKNIIKLVTIVAKYKLKGVARKLGF
ncbi:MAG: NAD(P)/FAD-dependent oxidoreductase [Candidatus Aenigmatarchaeota archaeon]